MTPEGIKYRAASREPYAVNRPNWEYRDGLPPLCTIHNEDAVWHKNSRRPSGGQWACKTCSRLKSRGLRRFWKTDHTDPLTYNLKRGYTYAKFHSKKIGREFSIPFELVMELWKTQEGKCAITGWPMSFTPGNKKRSRNKVTIDRIENSKGYTAGNVWLISDAANRAKTDLSKSELLDFAHGILRAFRCLPQ